MDDKKAELGTLGTVFPIEEVVQSGEGRNDGVLVCRGQLLHDVLHVRLVAENHCGETIVLASILSATHTASAVAYASHAKLSQLLILFFQAIQKQIQLTNNKYKRMITM